MIPLFTPDQVRGMDELAIGRGVAASALMERAAGHLARAVLDVGGRAYGLRVGILCGKGNNGGDGVAAARRLLDAGAYPLVHLVEGEAALSEDGRDQLRRLRRLGGREAPSVFSALRGADVVVDCLLGTGARGAPRDPYPDAVAALNGHGAPVVACDLPTGVDALTGAVPGEAVTATVTVTLGAHKVGLWAWPGRGHCGRIVLGDIGLAQPGEEPVASVMEGTDVAALLPALPPDADKRTRGVVVILAGAPGMSGAATMTARGAMAAGAGLVTVVTGSPERVAPTVPEALTVPLPEDPQAAFETVADQVERADALAVGPGLGTEPGTVDLVQRLVREVEVPLVLDADGLNAFRDHGDDLAEHASPLLVLTPHQRELGRLAADVWEDRLRRVPELAAKWGLTLVAKGPGMLTAAADGRLWVNPTGSSALATGGTGDVLTGMILALIASRVDAEQVAAGVWLHGLAGEEAARCSHPRSVTALDVASAVPLALAALEAGT